MLNYMEYIDKIGMVSAKSVLKNTGRDWAQWIKALSQNGAENLTHKEIVKILKVKYKQTLWWQQQIATGFEIHIGKKIFGQNHKGKYSTTTAKTIKVSNKKLWEFLNSESGINLWLEPLSEFQIAKGAFFEVHGGVFGEVRTILKGKRMRIKWNDSDQGTHSYLQVYVLPRDGKKCVLVFQHDEIASARDKEKLKNHWKNKAELIYEHLQK